jgi:hypothetical protein
LGLATRAGQGLSVVDKTGALGYVQQWNLNTQRELPYGLMLDLAYVGSHSVKTPEFWEMDQVNPSLYSMGSALNDSVKNPFYGVVTLGTLSSATVSRAQLLRPYPQFTSISDLVFAGNSNYNAFQAKLERRMSNGLNFLGSYTFSKTLGDSNALVNWLGDTTTGTQNNYNRRAERSLEPFDVSQRLIVNASYALPFGRGKSRGAHWNKALDLIAGGWQVNGIGTFQKGVPLAIGLNSSNTYGGSRPNSTGASAKLDSDARSLNRWFNTSVFTQPAAYSLGNVARTLPDVRTPGSENVDFSLFKIIAFTEQVRLQFRAEAFNALNHTRLSGPNTSYGSANFGRITSAGDPRMVQLALKLSF